MKVFKHTNKQRGIRSTSAVFVVIFLLAAGYIILNVKDFFAHDPFSTVLIILMFIAFTVPLFRRKGREIYGDLKISDSSVVIGGTLRFSLESLTMDRYLYRNDMKYHMYDKNKTFMLFTDREDGFISMVKDKISINDLTATSYSYSRTGDVVIKTQEGRTLEADMDTGVFSWTSDDDQREIFTPEHFVRFPYYRTK